MKDLFGLDPEVIFLNHGSFGACPKAVFEVYQDFQRELEWRPVEFLDRRFSERMSISRLALAEYVHARPEDIAFVPNATTGLNIVARSLKLGPGDEILMTDHEYGALDRTWRFICEKTGAIIKRVVLSMSNLDQNSLLETIWSAVNDRTRVLFLSQITSTTALLLPIQELVRRARRVGIISVIDGAHVPGQIPLNLDQLDPDFFVGNCHKWMLTPKGSAFLFTRPALQDLVEPLVVSWGWHPEKQRETPYIDLIEWQGTRDIAAYLTIPAALQFMSDHDWPAVRQKCRSLLEQAVELLTRETPLEPIVQPDRPYGLQIASFFLPPCDRDSVKSQLYDRFGIEVPIVIWKGNNVIRISIQAYNSLEDIKILTLAIREIFTWS
ncbi:aminotransferase class V-fold PLP-dependent enzyme [bacterium]|nr:aminotransferase class V-fold PLP-dependent enzyme [bacterium]